MEILASAWDLMHTRRHGYSREFIIICLILFLYGAIEIYKIFFFRK